LRKLSTKKFLSNSLCGVALGVGVPLGEAAAAVVVVVVAGDIAEVAGVVPASGEIPGAVAAGATGFVPVTVAPGAGGTAGFVAGATAGLTAAGLVAVVGGAPGGRFVGGAVGGGGWPNEVSARVTEQRLAISSVFIGLVGKFSRARIPMSWLSCSMR
jgi:hypothetical protein